MGLDTITTWYNLLGRVDQILLWFKVNTSFQNFLYIIHTKEFPLFPHLQ
jgi:hypothetical protein